MSLLKRFGFFFIGLAIGVVILLYMANQKEKEKGGESIFPYGMDARTLKSIRVKKHRVFTKDALEFMKVMSIDTADITNILKYGDVDFSKSQTRTEPCKKYWIDVAFKNQDLSLIIERCDSTATIEKIILNE